MGAACCKYRTEHRESLSQYDNGSLTSSSLSDISDFQDQLRIKKANKFNYVEFLEDIESIRHAARNICLLSQYDWHIDTIKALWNMTIKMWIPSDFTGLTEQDSRDYLKLRFNQTKQILENRTGLKFSNRNLDDTGFNLLLVIGIDKDEKDEKDLKDAILSLFFVASEQKGTECKLLAGQGLINLEDFKDCIGLNSYSDVSFE